MHLPDALRAYWSSPKFATRFSPFSLVYRMEVMNLAEVMTPSLGIMQAWKKEKEKEFFAAERCEDLERLDEKREEAQEHNHRYRQRMTEAYGRTTKERVFAEGQLILKIADHIRRAMAGPSKFPPKWEGPFVIREAHASEYYH